MTLDDRHELQEAVRNMRRKHSKEQIRLLFVNRELESTFSYMGRLAIDRTVEPHVYVWEGFDIAVGNKYSSIALVATVAVDDPDDEDN